MGGNLSFYGNKVLNSWKYNKWASKQDTMVMDKFRISCKPLQFGWGKTYVINRLSVLRYISKVADGILTALLAIE